MYKEFENGVKISLPWTTDTNIYVEGHGTYTILDVASSGLDIYALLESNIRGEEDTLVVTLPVLKSKLRIIKRYDGEQMLPAGRSTKADYIVFLREKEVVCEAYNDLKTELEALLNEERIEALEFWSEEEINDINKEV